MNNSDKLINSMLSKNNNSDNEALKQAIKNKDKETLINSLSMEDKQKLNQVLSDKNALENLLKTPEAQSLMRSLFGGKNG